MKCVFLDIDGVLNSGYSSKCDKSPNGWLGLDDDLIKIAQPLLTAEDTKVILSSTWRRCSDGDLEWLQERLKAFDIIISDMTTCDISEDRRDLQIIDFINKNISSNDSFVILDDSFIDVFRQYKLDKNYVPIEWKNGVTKENIMLAEGILRRKVGNQKFGSGKYIVTKEKRFGRK